MPRWAPAVLLSLALLTLGARPGGVDAPGYHDPDGNLSRAILAYSAMRARFAGGPDGIYLDTYPLAGERPYTHLWGYSQVMAAALDVAALPAAGSTRLARVPEHVAVLDAYWNPEAEPPAYDSYVRPPHGSGGDIFYDDNAWIGIELVRAYHLTGDQAALTRAAELFTFAVSGWRDDPALPAPGGVRWVKAWWNEDRNTVSTASSAYLGLLLYEATGDPYYLDWARRMYEWTNRHLRAPDGLYWDTIRADGSVETTPWSYNQGTMIGASVLLHRVTGDPAYLQLAEETASAALDLYAGDGLYRQSAAFNAIFFRNLLLLGAVNGDSTYRAATQRYADEVWDRYRVADTGLFVFDPNQPANVLNHAAMVQLYALLASSAAGGDISPGRLEAGR